MLKTMDSGAQNRKVAFTGMNERSSRSHSLFIVQLSQKNLKKDSSKQSKLYFVDLAGSEKVSKTGCQGQQL
jgi:kinesin family protein 5